MSNAINTGKAQRRKIRLESPDQAIVEADRIAVMARNGTAQYSGNWDAGQILNHVAAWAEYAYVPNPLKAPWFVRLLLRPMKGKFLNQGFPAGRNIPNVPGGTLAAEPVGVEVALVRFKLVFERLKTNPPTEPSPVFGKMTHEEAIKLNLRHAELHMSFVKN